MEKFSKWRDPGSGIQPFLPIKKTFSESDETSKLYWYLNDFVLGPVLGSVKFIILLLLILPIWFTLAWIFVLLKIPFGVLRTIDSIFGRISLFLMGFYVIGRKRMIIRPAIAALARPYESFSLHTEKSVSPSDSIAPGDWVIANLSSYCDLILYWYTYSGVVTILKSNFELEPCVNRFKVLWYYFIKNPTESTTTTSNSTSPFSCSFQYPLIIFPEGTSSNGRGILKFIANLSSTRRNQRLHLTCTKYQSALFSPTFPDPSLSGFLFHLWRLCSQLENCSTTRTILPSALFSSNFDLPLASENPAQFDRTLQQIIAALGHLRPLSLDAKDKSSFLQSFKED